MKGWKICTRVPKSVKVTKPTLVSRSLTGELTPSTLTLTLDTLRFQYGSVSFSVRDDRIFSGGVSLLCEPRDLCGSESLLTSSRRTDDEGTTGLLTPRDSTVGGSSTADSHRRVSTPAFTRWLSRSYKLERRFTGERSLRDLPSGRDGPSPGRKVQTLRH